MNGPSRRLLAASGSLVASLAGCLGEYPDESASVEASEYEDGEPIRTTETTTGATRTTGSTSDYSATVNATTTVERDEIEYVPENDAVRYVAAYRHSNHDAVENGSKPEREPVYETIPFDDWAEIECAHVGAKRVMAALSDRLDGETEGVSAGVTTDDGRKTIVVAHRTLLNRDGEEISKPSASYDRVKRVAPERAEVTLTLSGRTHSCDAPVTTRKKTLRQD